MLNVSEISGAEIQILSIANRSLVDREGKRECVFPNNLGSVQTCQTFPWFKHCPPSHRGREQRLRRKTILGEFIIQNHQMEAHITQLWVIFIV